MIAVRLAAARFEDLIVIMHPVAIDAHLADDYLEHHGVRCEDDLVHNDYEILKPGGREPDGNHHKSYGYLRTPEFSALVNGFLTSA